MQKNIDSPTSLLNVQHPGRCWFVTMDLVSLIRRVQELIKANDLAMAAVEPDEADTDVVVLDDVTPRYLIENATLNVCRAQLRETLNSLLSAPTARQREHQCSAVFWQIESQSLHPRGMISQ